jgi:5'(3')-deoxyribonucleotidase
MSDLDSNDLTQFIETVYNVYLNVFKNAKTTNSRKLQSIAMIIYNYLMKLFIDHNVSIQDVKITDKINMIPFFQFIENKNIQLFDFENIQECDMNTNNEKDIERFVLSHIYYLTQHNKQSKTI